MTSLAECPSSADLAAFADGTLESARREAIAAHLLACESCYFVLTEAAAILNEVETEDRPRDTVAPFRRRPILLALAAALAILVSIPIARRFAGPAEQRLTAPLTDVSWESRPIEARLSMFDYAAPPRVSRGNTTRPTLEVLAAAAKIEKETTGKTDTANLHARAIAELATGRPGDAVARLERAASVDASAALLSDLSAAYLARGRASGGASDFVAAYEAARKALAKEPKLAPAAFNAALALEAQSFLRREAIAAWDDYLAIDARSGWADEARRRQQELRALPAPQSSKDRRRAIDQALTRGYFDDVRKLAGRAPQEARMHAEETLFDAWAGADDDARRGSIVEGLRAIGDALALRGDPWIGNAASALASAEGEKRDRLQTGLRLAAEARNEYRNQRLEAALEKVAAAKRQLDGTPFTPWVTILRGSIEFVRRDGPMQYDVDRSSPSLAARAEWLRGLAAGVSGSPFAARTHLMSAAERLTAIGEKLEAATARMWAAQALEFLGEEDASWESRLQAVAEVIDGGAGAERVHVSLHAVAETAHRRGADRFAGLLARKMLREAQHEKSAERAVDALTVLAVASAAEGDAVRGGKSIDEAVRYARSIEDERARERTMLFVDRAATEAFHSSDPARAMTHARAAIQRGARLGDHVRTNEIRTELASLLRANGSSREAEAILLTVIADTEARRHAVNDPSLRRAFSDTASKAFDSLLDLLVAERRFDDAYAILLRTRGGGKAGSARAGLARSATKPADALVFAVLRDRTLRWELSETGRTVTLLPVGREALAKTTDTFRANLRDDVLAESLYSTLIGSVTFGDRLLIVADESLHRLPFAILRDARTGKRLVEQTSVVIAAAAESSGGERAPAGPARALVVGNPQIADAFVANLPPLPQAAREARKIATFYPEVTLLEGREATKGSFLEGVARSRVVHFAGHGVSSNTDAGGSALFLSAADDDGVLSASDLETRDLRGVEVMVLAGCRTAEGRTFSLEGMTGMARAALTAGAQSVIATLGDIDDAASAHLFVEFHSLVARGMAPEEALRLVQMRMIASADPRFRDPAAWGLVQAMTAGL